uniref:BH3-interacting domain death agonist n=1 Tax=Mastacembelus armatus TaxID=205130 RepID=A0A3Q3KU67_9TELE
MIFAGLNNFNTRTVLFLYCLIPLSISSFKQWMNLLTGQVEWVMRQGVGLDHLPQERVIVALTLTLVKGVCEYFPQLLRNLFYTALQFIRSSRST